jgi:polyhydroxyalkanoate synthesis repressor PhaR
MSEPRIIKKYPNRRLYDTAISSYITLAEVKKLVMEHTPFVIQDAKTGEDLTRSILLQIILEQEERGEPIFTSDALEQLIRFYGGTLQGMVGGYLEKSFELLTEQQDRIHGQVQNMMGHTPLSYMTGLAEQNFKLWREMQENFFRAAMLGLGKKTDTEK